MLEVRIRTMESALLSRHRIRTWAVRIWAVLPFFLFLILPARSLSQNKADGGATHVPAIKVRTELVLIPAEATDAKGNRVTDLKKEDFAVFENGNRQEIALFDHIRTKAEVMRPAAVPRGIFTNMVEQSQSRITIFVLDLLNSKIEDQKEARKQLLDFLSKSLNGREPLCLLAVDANGVWLIHGFTSDPKALADAVNALRQEPTEMDRPPKNPEEELYKTFAGWHTKNPRRAQAALEARIKMLQTAIGFQDASADERIRLTLLSLLEIGNAFIGIPGRKSLIWATAGFPFEVNDAAAFSKEGSRKGADAQGLLPLYEQTWRVLEEANIAVYPLDVSELVNPAYVSAGMGEPLPQHLSLDTHVANLENFADVTGGKFCDRSVDAKKCFEEAAADSSDYYLLGIYDRSGTEKPGWRKLSVRTAREGVKIRARSGYYLNAAAHDRPTDTKLMETALFSPFDYTGLPLSVRFTGTSTVSPQEKKIVAFEYAIPSGAVRLDEQTGNQLELEFGAVARDSEGKMQGSFTKVVQGKMSEAQVRQVKEKGILFTGQMELGPGEYALSFAVIDRVNENTGSVTAPLKVD